MTGGTATGPALAGPELLRRNVPAAMMRDVFLWGTRADAQWPGQAEVDGHVKSICDRSLAAYTWEGGGTDVQVSGSGPTQKSWLEDDRLVVCFAGAEHGYIGSISRT